VYKGKFNCKMPEVEVFCLTIFSFCLFSCSTMGLVTYILFLWRCAPTWARSPHSWGF